MLVVLIGGMDSDPTPAQIQGTARRHEGNSGLYRLRSDLQQPRIIPEYFNWNGTRAGDIHNKQAPVATSISTLIREHIQAQPRDRVVLVGNSWGGHTACLVCQELSAAPEPLAVDLVLFLDPASSGRKELRPKELPVNINRAINYHTRHAVVWRKWNAGQRLLNIDLGDPQHGFLISGGPAYDSYFDFQAHIAAEWDERIHQRLQADVLSLLRDP